MTTQALQGALADYFAAWVQDLALRIETFDADSVTLRLPQPPAGAPLAPARPVAPCGPTAPAGPVAGPSRSRMSPSAAVSPAAKNSRPVTGLAAAQTAARPMPKAAANAVALFTDWTGGWGR